MRPEDMRVLGETYKGLFPQARNLEFVTRELYEIFKYATLEQVIGALRACAIESPNLPAIASLRKLIPNHRLEGDRSTTANLVRFNATPEDDKRWKDIYWQQNQMKDYYYHENGKVKRKIDKITDVLGKYATDEYKKFYGGKTMSEIVSLFQNPDEVKRYRYFENLMFEVACEKEKELRHGKGTATHRQ